MTHERIGTPAERELAAAFRDVRRMKADDVDLGRVEREILEHLKAVGREMLSEAMDARSDGMTNDV